MTRICAYSFDDFTECFPLYVEEDKNGASATYNSISDYIEAQNFVCALPPPTIELRSFNSNLFNAQRDLDKLFKDYVVQENIDILHRVVTEAKDRKAKGDIGKDVWREDLEPRAAVSARTVPILEQETKRLCDTLAAVRDYVHDC